MYSIMRIGEPSQAEYSIHESDIDNMNRVFFESAARVVNGCSKLGILFFDQEEELVSAVVHILDNH